LFFRFSKVIKMCENLPSFETIPGKQNTNLIALTVKYAPYKNKTKQNKTEQNRKRRNKAKWKFHEYRNAKEITENSVKRNNLINLTIPVK